MRVHHLNCGSMRPPGGPLVCHVLLVETDNGLVLVDSGYGLDDIADPAGRLGPIHRLFDRAFDPEEAAVRQVERLGFCRDDVRHIVVTHLDSDHIGGLSDFPHAEVHVTSAEALGAMHAPSRREKVRFRRAQWAHGPKIVEHDPGGDEWRGFPAAKALDEVSPGIVLVSLAGHSRGHAGVAVDAGHRWLLHAGDAFFHRGTVDGRSRVPLGIRAFEAVTALDRRRVRENHERLAELYQRADPDLVVLCAHDPTLFELARSSA